MQWRRYALYTGSALLALAWTTLATYLLLKLPRGGTGSDFGIFLAAGQALRFDPHANIYQAHTLLATVQAHGGCKPWHNPLYVYPPLLAILLIPFTYLPCTYTTYLWHALTIALWAGCTLVMARRALAIGPWQALAVTALSAFFLPLMQGLEIGQVHVVVLACCLGALVLAQRNRPSGAYSAGALLAFGAFIKYFPAFLILYFLLRGQWRVVAGAAVAGVVLVLAQALIVGPQTLLDGVFGSLHSVQGQSHGLWVSAVPGGIAFAALAFLGFVAGVLWAARRGSRGKGKGGDAWLGLGWALCTMLLLSPLVWWFYLTWLLPAFAACLYVALDPQQRLLPWQRWSTLAALAAAYATMTLIRFNDATSVLATLLLWTLCGVLYLRSAGITLSPFRRIPQHQPQRQPVPAMAAWQKPTTTHDDPASRPHF
ncbi:MAG: hypothetical protein OJF49_003119 [Ktedonobacterales bacterium]|jgi:hypothetical protein|nr:MAG: hypothetical protein OJF49_003119 [Ktedonobacterales bacterium]